MAFAHYLSTQIVGYVPVTLAPAMASFKEKMDDRYDY